MKLNKNPVFLHYFIKFMGILLFVLEYMYMSLLLKMINGFSWPGKIMASPSKLSFMLCAVAAPEFVFVRGIEGAKCVSEGAKLQKWLILTIFSFDWGESRGRVSDWGYWRLCPHLPPSYQKKKNCQNQPFLANFWCCHWLHVSFKIICYFLMEVWALRVDYNKS